jgi:hypothetical protein
LPFLLVRKTNLHLLPSAISGFIPALTALIVLGSPKMSTLSSAKETFEDAPSWRLDRLEHARGLFRI